MTEFSFLDELSI